MAIFLLTSSTRAVMESGALVLLENRYRVVRVHTSTVGAVRSQCLVDVRHRQDLGAVGHLRTAEVAVVAATVQALMVRRSHLGHVVEGPERGENFVGDGGVTLHLLHLLGE